MSDAKHIYELYIRTTPERLWEAIVGPAFTRRYFGGTVESDWKAGSPYRYTHNDGWSMHFGSILEIDPPRILVHTFQHDYSDEHGGGPDDISTVTWEIEPLGEVCKLTLVHDYPAGETKSFASSGTGWPMILSGLKSLLETGRELHIQDRGQKPHTRYESALRGKFPDAEVTQAVREDAARRLRDTPTMTIGSSNDQRPRSDRPRRPHAR